MSRHAHGCGDCIHDGCCEGLPHCGGGSWAPAYGVCAQCGGRVSLEDVEYETEDGKHIFCSEGCLNEWERDHADEGEEAVNAALAALEGGAKDE